MKWTRDVVLMGRRKMHKEFSLVNLKEKYHLEELGVWLWVILRGF
jgi:hypothetical protein